MSEGGVPWFSLRPRLFSSKWDQDSPPTDDLQRGPHEVHRVRVSSSLEIAVWVGLGVALIVVALWLWHVLPFLSVVVWILALAALGTALAAWRENRWLRPLGGHGDHPGAAGSA